MLAIIFIIISFLSGLIILQRLIPEAPSLVRIAGAYIISVVISACVAYITANSLSSITDNPTFIGFLVAFTVHILIIISGWKTLKAPSLRLSKQSIFLIVVSLIFSFWLMECRFSTQNETVGFNSWGDLTFHTSIARSFSWGHGFPPQYPFYGDAPIHYHFGFDFYAGLLESAGLPITWAFNLPGGIGFTAMMVLIYSLASFLFRSSASGWIAVSLLITNSSLAFTRYMEKYDYNVVESLKHLWEKKDFAALGPYDGGDITGYWTLNVFTTQTHLIIAVALTLLVAFGLIQPIREKRPINTPCLLIFGVLFGLSFWINGIIYIAAMLFFCSLLFIFKRWKEFLIFTTIAGLFAIPQALWLNEGIENQGNIQIHLGYLVKNFQLDQLASYWDFVKYWWLNLSFALPLLILGALFANRDERKILAAMMVIFLFGNVIGLGRDIGGQMHKLFNLWEVFINIFVAYAVVRIWNARTVHFKIFDSTIGSTTSRLVLRSTLSFAFFIMILSGIVDFMVFKNDNHTNLLPNKEAINWIRDNVPKGALFLTKPGVIVAPPALAGRAIFLGFESWAHSAGYDTKTRKEISFSVYQATSKEEACRLLINNGIDYVQYGYEERGETTIAENEDFFRENFVSVYNKKLEWANYMIFDVEKSCSHNTQI